MYGTATYFDPFLDSVGKELGKVDWQRSPWKHSSRCHKKVGSSEEIVGAFRLWQLAK
jgi:hypothetical protein